jgi:hypothetical protein
MSRDAEYWQRAVAAFKYAKLAANERDKAAWLRIAEGFDALFRKNQTAEEEALYGACVIADRVPTEPVSLN